MRGRAQGGRRPAVRSRRATFHGGSNLGGRRCPGGGAGRVERRDCVATVSAGVSWPSLTLAATSLLLLATLGVVAHSSSGSSKSSSTRLPFGPLAACFAASLDEPRWTVASTSPWNYGKGSPPINKDRIHGGKVKIDNAHVMMSTSRPGRGYPATAKRRVGPPCRAMIRTVRVAKQNNHLIFHVPDKHNSKRS